MSLKEQGNSLILPKTICEFFPKNYIKKKKASFEEYIPTKKKENPSNIHPKYRKNKNKFSINNTQIKSKKKDSEKKDELNIEEEYSGLISNNTEKKPELKNNNNLNKNKFFLKYSEDNCDFKTKWKTEMCHYWEMYGTCKYGNTCAFAHGVEELNKRKMSSNYKTKPCKQFFEIGYCTYGKRCQFSHKIKEEKEIDKENQISYLKILKEFNDQNKEISHEIIKRPRLMTFEDITKSGKEIKEKNRLALYEDILEIKKKENEEPEKVFSEDTEDDNYSINNDINNLLNEDEENFEINFDDFFYNENEEKNNDNNNKNGKQEDNKIISD